MEIAESLATFRMFITFYGHHLTTNTGLILRCVTLGQGAFVPVTLQAHVGEAQARDDLLVRVGQSF